MYAAALASYGKDSSGSQCRELPLRDRTPSRLDLVQNERETLKNLEDEMIKAINGDFVSFRTSWRYT